MVHRQNDVSIARAFCSLVCTERSGLSAPDASERGNHGAFLAVSTGRCCRGSLNDVAPLESTDRDARILHRPARMQLHIRVVASPCASVWDVRALSVHRNLGGRADETRHLTVLLSIVNYI